MSPATIKAILGVTVFDKVQPVLRDKRAKIKCFNLEYRNMTHNMKLAATTKRWSDIMDMQDDLHISRNACS